MGDGKQIIDILLPILQNKLQVQAAQAPTAPYTESQAVQTPSALYNNLAGIWTITNKGLNMARQDIPNISSEPNKTPPLITKLSF